MTKDLPTLYKPDSKGKVREWRVDTLGDSVLVSHGVRGGKEQQKETKVFGKNIGKANETTPEAQARKVALAKWTHQKDRKGYGLTPEEAVLNKKPMLAYDYHKHGHRITYPAGVQPKLDGIRALVCKMSEGIVSITSRTGKTFGADLSHLEAALDAALEVGVILDGELYNHDMELEDINSAIQKTNDNTPNIEFWVFDLADDKMDNGRRAGAMHMGFIPELPLRLVRTELAVDEAAMIEKHNVFVSAGFEGVMVRNREGMYKFSRRSADLQKYKVMMDGEYRVVDIEEDIDGYPKFVCAAASGTFKTTINGEKNETLKYLENKDEYIGKWLNVQYQKVYRKTGLPQFPKGKYFRDCLDNGTPTT